MKFVTDICFFVVFQTKLKLETERNKMTTSTTKTIFTPKVIFTSDEMTSPKTLLKASSQQTPGKRKLSFPVTFHSTLLLSDSNALSRTTRRLSNVSDRVSDRVRKLSTAMGWTHAPSKDVLISQAKFLITLYIRFRVKRSGILNQQKKKMGLQKMQRNMLIGADIKEVFIALKEVSESHQGNHEISYQFSFQAATVLESMHIKTFTNVSRQLTGSSNSGFDTAEDTAVLLTTFGKIMFKSDVTWGKVISLFSVTAALSIDLVRQNHEDYIPTLIEGFLGVVEDELIGFLSENNGWTGLHHKVQIKPENNRQWLMFIVLLSLFVVLMTINNCLLKT